MTLEISDDADMIQQQLVFDNYGCYSYNIQTQTSALIDLTQRDSSSSSMGHCTAPAQSARTRTRKRQRRSTSVVKKKEQVEHQRMTHIAVERNRRNQMNLYLSLLKSIMPPSYVHRGDQASIVGGAINFVKELEQLLHSLEAARKRKRLEKSDISNSDVLLEVRKVERHVNLKIVLRKQPPKLLFLKMLKGFHSLSLTVVHINLTTCFHHCMLLLSLSLKVEDDCKMSSVDEISGAVYQMLGRFQEETVSNCPFALSTT